MARLADGRKLRWLIRREAQRRAAGLSPAARAELFRSSSPFAGSVKPAALQALVPDAADRRCAATRPAPRRSSIGRQRRPPSPKTARTGSAAPPSGVISSRGRFSRSAAPPRIAPETEPRGRRHPRSAPGPHLLRVQPGGEQRLQVEQQRDGDVRDEVEREGGLQAAQRPRHGGGSRAPPPGRKAAQARRYKVFLLASFRTALI